MAAWTVVHSAHARIVCPTRFSQAYGGTVHLILLAGIVLHPSMDPWHHMVSLLGYPFLNQFGAVGFNQRTHQLLLYQKS